MGASSGSSPGEEPPTLCMNLERDPQAPSLARAAVEGFSEQSELADSGRATLKLLVSELVSNAVLHSDAPPASGIVLRASLLREGIVRVEVTDQGNGFTASARAPAREHGGGYGLFLVETQATRWGVDREGGTRVWFEIADEPGQAEPSVQLALNRAASSDPPVASPGL
jgi:anti-sigma regulatory factor (Ser/Thr protein kinase)